MWLEAVKIKTTLSHLSKTNPNNKFIIENRKAEMVNIFNNISKLSLKK